MESVPVSSKLQELQKCVLSLGAFGPAHYNLLTTFIPWHFVAPATLNPSLCTASEILDSLLIFDLLI